MNGEESLAIERLFHLGDFKSLKVKVGENDLTEINKYNLMVDLAADVYEQLFIHQLITAKLAENEKTTKEYEESLIRVEEIRNELKIKET